MSTEPISPNPAGALERHENRIVAALIAYFAVRVCFLLVNFEAGMLPDELTHMQRVEAFQAGTGDPAVLAAATFIPGEPPLYYHVAALLIRFNVFPISDLTFLRLVNMIFGVTTVLYGWRWIRWFTPNVLTRVLFVLVITNVLMFTAMSAAVSYDPLVFACAAAVIYHLTRYLLQHNPIHLLLLLAFAGVGTLTKTAFLPLAAIAVACAAVYVLRHNRSIRIADFFNTKARVGLVFLVFMVLGANVWLYGANLMRYSRLVPTKNQVYSDTLYMTSPLWARNTITQDYRLGRLSFGQAVLLAREIDNEHVRRDTESLLKREAVYKRRGLVFKPLPRYIYPFPWLQTMAETSLGLLAHRPALKTGVWLMPYGAVALLALVGLCLRWRPWRPESVENYMIAIAVFYVLVLMQLVNYTAYLKSEELNIALQGRYLFPVLVPMVGLFAHYYLAPWQKRVQLFLFVVAAIVFFSGAFPFFLLTADTSKFFGQP